MTLQPAENPSILPSKLELVDTHGLVEREEALKHSAAVYQHFANPNHVTDYYIELSHTVRQDLGMIDDPCGIEFGKDLAGSLEWHDLIVRGLGQQAARLSLRGLISVNMIVPEAADDGTLLAHLQEPFMEAEVLNGYFQDFVKRQEEQRRFAERQVQRS